MAVQLHPPGIGAGEADGHIKGGRLPRAVGPEQADDFPGRDIQADAAHDRPATVRLGEVVRAQRRHEPLNGHGVR